MSVDFLGVCLRTLCLDLGTILPPTSGTTSSTSPVAVKTTSIPVKLKLPVEATNLVLKFTATPLDVNDPGEASNLLSKVTGTPVKLKVPVELTRFILKTVACPAKLKLPVSAVRVTFPEEGSSTGIPVRTKEPVPANSSVSNVALFPVREKEPALETMLRAKEAAIPVRLKVPVAAVKTTGATTSLNAT